MDHIINNINRLGEQQRTRLRAVIERIGAAYPDDPGTSDLDDEQPVSVPLDLGDVRLAWGLLREE